MNETPIPGANASIPAPVKMASDGNPPACAPVGTHSPAATGGAKQTAPLFGGLRGGRKRADGLVPGSPEAREADLAKDRERKRLKAAEQRAQDPTPLPSVNESGPTQTAGTTVPVDFGGEVSSACPLPWKPEDLRPILKELIPAAEEFLIARKTGRLSEAKIPGKLIGEIERDLRWQPAVKTALEIGASETVAKYANKAGLSSEYKPEFMLVGAVGAIFAASMRSDARIEKLIQEFKATQTAPKP